MSDLHKDLKSLGQSANANADTYAESMNSEDCAALLERFPSPASKAEMNPAGVELSLNITTSEFTSLCPMTGQPDFATIVIEYVPGDWCVESKSLKLYFLGFRNRRDFHESCVVKIANDLVKLLDPEYLKVVGQFTPRGGIPFWPTVEYDRPYDRDPAFIS